MEWLKYHIRSIPPLNPKKRQDCCGGETLRKRHLSAQHGKTGWLALLFNSLIIIQLLPQNRQSAKLFSSSRNWDSPSPSPAGECAPPPLWFRGEGHTHWRKRGWESPNSDEGAYTVVLFINMYFVVVAIGSVLYLSMEYLTIRQEESTKPTPAKSRATSFSRTLKTKNNLNE